MAKKHKLKPQEEPPHIDDPMFEIVGLDLSLECTGLALLRYDAASRSVRLLKNSIVNNKRRPPIPRGAKLANVADALAEYIKSSHVKIIARENSFSRFNQETIALNMVNGVAEHFIWQIHQVGPYAIAPTSIKKLVTGSGKASKEEVAEAVGNYCDHKNFKTDDMSDAVAVALAFLIQFGYIDQKPLPKYSEQVTSDVS